MVKKLRQYSKLSTKKQSKIINYKKYQKESIAWQLLKFTLTSKNDRKPSIWR
jgi:hypothetical protein